MRGYLSAVMKRMFPVLLSVLWLPLQLAAQDSKVAGIWEGKLDVGAISIQMVLRVTFDDGKLSATIESPNQGPQRFIADTFTISDHKLSATFKVVFAEFTATLSADGKTLDGRWKQAGTDLPLKLTKTDKATVLARPQEPKPPFPYDIVEVTFENKAANATLSGTLTVPHGSRKWPTVILVSGSGPQDRDETILGHRPFWVLADYLSRRGIAVLRYDDRGVGKSTGDRLKATTIDFAGDALAGIQFLKTRKEVDPQKIGIIGHSEGGTISAIAAAKSQDVAFVVSMAGTGVPGEEIVLLQAALIARVTGQKEEDIQKDNAFRKKLFDLMAQEISDDEAKIKAIELSRNEFERLPKDAKERFGTVESFAASVVTPIVSPWFRVFLTLDPAEYWERVRVPALILNGEKDLQVSADQNLPKIEAALKEANNTRYTVKRFENLNHLFQTAKTGSPQEYAAIEETIAPVVLKTIADWILRVMG